jgi:hypothetical protein
MSTVRVKQMQLLQILTGGKSPIYWQIHNLLIHVRSLRIAAVPLFPGLRRFREGRGFKQWTGDDSKALMKVCSSCDQEFLSRLLVHNTGLPPCYIGPCTSEDGSRDQCFHGILLSCAAFSD